MIRLMQNTIVFFKILTRMQTINTKTIIINNNDVLNRNIRESFKSDNTSLKSTLDSIIVFEHQQFLNNSLLEILCLKEDDLTILPKRLLETLATYYHNHVMSFLTYNDDHVEVKFVFEL